MHQAFWYQDGKYGATWKGNLRKIQWTARSGAAIYLQYLLRACKWNTHENTQLNIVNRERRLLIKQTYARTHVILVLSSFA